MRWSYRASVLALLILIPWSAAEAQRVPDRSGFWFGAGIGLGSARLSCTICTTGRDGGTSGYVHMGATVTKQLLVGGEVLAWYHTDNGVDFLLASVQAVVVLYPMRTSGFYIKTGLGVSNYSAKDSVNKVSSQALAGEIGVGYEVLVSNNISMVPFANFLGTSGADVKFNNTVSSLGARTSLIQIGLGITLH